MSSRPPFSRTLPYVLRGKLEELTRIELFAARVSAVPDARHVVVELGGTTTKIPRLAGYAAVVGDSAQILAQGSTMLAIGAVK